MGNPLAVREMLSFNEIASPATIHKHLSALRRSGYVFATSDGDDKRTKHLVVSSQGIVTSISYLKPLRKQQSVPLTECVHYRSCRFHPCVRIVESGLSSAG
jgi:SOS-response transcriptional repressor LexA